MAGVDAVLGDQGPQAAVLSPELTVIGEPSWGTERSVARD